MTYVHPLDHAHASPHDDVVRLVGGKAANLGVMARDLGLPVPPGFVISTAACRAVLANGWPSGLDAEIEAGIADIEARLGRRLGGTDDPLLVSVRSGAPVSMPGMMDTILNVGATTATEPGLAAIAGPDFAADCRRRLVATFREIVGAGDPPDDAGAQLRQAIEAVFRSWESPRARTYRAREGVADDLGTAVTVQAMVFGNRDDRSATGVAFTRDPATGEPVLYGDVLFGAQGEDVVAGTHRTEPLTSLDTRLPAVAAELRQAATRLEQHYADLCDIEFTVESGRLWLLQVRVGKRSPEAALRLAVDMAEDARFPLSREAAVRRVAPLLADPPRAARQAGPSRAPIVVGLPASPGIATGGIATDPEAAMRLADAGRPVILVREQTSPDDVHGMAGAKGILTARGGIASHAAVVARGWGIPAVVGAEDLRVFSDRIEVDGRVIATGETLTIDGGSGAVFVGEVLTTSEVVPAAATLLSWAEELGIPIGRPAATIEGAAAIDGPARTAADREGARGPDDAVPGVDATIQALVIKGMATAEALAPAIGAASPESAATALVALEAAGLATSKAAAYRPTAAGREHNAALIAEQRATVGQQRADTLLEQLLTFDSEMKRTVTAWQMRDGPAGEQVLNDHADAAYDADVLRRLDALATDADRWLADAAMAVPRLGLYQARLRRAADAALAGDGRFVASPRVDSYHSIWFELHEELIQLAGRTREEEAAAGRA